MRPMAWLQLLTRERDCIGERRVLAWLVETPQQRALHLPFAVRCCVSVGGEKTLKLNIKQQLKFTKTLNRVVGNSPALVSFHGVDHPSGQSSVTEWRRIESRPAWVQCARFG